VSPRPREALATGGVLALAAAASIFLSTRLPLAPDDPFHGTLALLPLLLAGFHQLHRWAVRRGGLPLPARGTAGEVVVLGLLGVLALARPHLGLARTDEVVAAALLLVLGYRVVRQTIALRPLLGSRLPRRPSLLFLFLPFLVYLALLPWSARHRQPDGDEPYYLLITHSLAYDFDADLTNNYRAGDWRHYMDRPLAPQPGDPVGQHGEQYSRHNEALPMLLALPYRLGGKTGALVTMALVAALLSWMTLRLARHYQPGLPVEALAVYGLAAFAPPLLLYSYQVWVEVPAALLVAVALDRLHDLKEHRTWGWKQWLGLGLPILLLPLVKIRFLLIAAPLLAMAWWYAGRPRRPILLLGALLVAVAGGILLYNHFLYANPLKIHSWQELDLHQYRWLSYLAGGLGIFFDAAFGLFACAPVWLLLLAAVPLLAVRRDRLLLDLAALTLPYLLIVAPRNEWYGGWSPPFRYALIALPLLALTLIPLFARRDRPGARALLAGLGALTLALTLVWVISPGWTYNFADGGSYVLDALNDRLGVDLARLFPSSVRPRAATWLWPPLTLLLIPLLWWLPGRRGGVWKPAFAGVAGLLLLAAALPAVAARLPTRVVELEDSQVFKSGGHPHPDLWVIDRTRFQGGWVLRVGEWMRVPVNPGGKRVRLTLYAQLIRNQPVPFRLEVKAGDRLLAVWQPSRPRVWESVELAPFEWRADEPLTLAAYGEHPPGELNAAILDRIELDWM